MRSSKNRAFPPVPAMLLFLPVSIPHNILKRGAGRSFPVYRIPADNSTGIIKKKINLKRSCRYTGILDLDCFVFLRMEKPSYTNAVSRRLFFFYALYIIAYFRVSMIRIQLRARTWTRPIRRNWTAMWMAMRWFPIFTWFPTASLPIAAFSGIKRR